MQQFENLRASSLYCNKCKAAMPVRERLLLVLPDKEIYDYLCTSCASSVGQREVTAADKITQAMAARRSAKPAARRRCSCSCGVMRVLFMGTGEIGLPVLNFLLGSTHELVGVVTQPDKPAGRKLEPRASPVKMLAEKNGLRVFQPDRIRDRAAIEEIEKLSLDLIVVISYGQIVPREILAAPRIACINLHASLLPRHRGAAPIQAAIQAGDRESGITVMYMDEGLDSGDILLEKKIALRRRETGGTLHDRLAELAPVALGEALPLLEAERAPRTPQNSELATYAKKLTREKGRLDWNAPAVEIDRKIRAFNPWPTAFTTFPLAGGQLAALKIFSSIVIRKQAGPPGKVIVADARGILVGAGEGALLLREIQLEGKRRMPAGAFLLGHPLPTGTPFV